jgi:hypothetical protein
VAQDDPIFRKGSLIPPVLDLEADLIEQEQEARAYAERIVFEARRDAEQLIAETKKRLPRIEASERDKLADSLLSSTGFMHETHDSEIRELEAGIARNHRRALDYLLHKLIPDWDGVYPG